MADSAVDIFLETLKQLRTSSKLALVMKEEQRLLYLYEKIRYLRGFLMNMVMTTEKTSNEYAEVMKLATQIRDVVSEAEIIVERFVIHAFKSDASCSIPESHDHLDLESVKKKFEALTDEVNQIYDEKTYENSGAAAVKRHQYSSAGSGSLGSSIQCNTSKVIEKEVVVGFEKEVEKVRGMLEDGRSNELKIINIIGAPGGGKTTLAKEVYDHYLKSEKFGIRAWVDISGGYDTTLKSNLLIRILESVSPGKHASDDVNKLGEEVLKCLKGKKYLIVMDDVWNTTAWDDIQRSFPKEDMGSRVLFTSRFAVKFDGFNCVPHELGSLGEDSSWKLLKMKVFGLEPYPPELEDIGKQIAKKCGGLPLAIVAVAGILAAEVTEHKTVALWNNIAEHLSSTIAKEDQGGCMEILELSYNHLPLHLRTCFLYIGGFTEDSEIPVRDLKWLWIGEGLIQKSEGKSLEDLAKDYLDDLIARNLVMVPKKSSLGRVKACRIHDLIRELCLNKAKEGNFLVRISKDGSVTSSAHRRFFGGHQLFQSLGSDTPFLRSFLCLSLQNSSSSPSEQNLSFFENFELLRVLSFISASCQGEIGVGHLVHLRYLALKLQTNNESCWSYPTPFSYLLNLEILNLEVSREVDIELPRYIFKMVKLRHLYSKIGLFNYHLSRSLSFNEAAEFGFDGSSKLESLQTLHRICCCPICRCFLGSTPNLKKLGLYGRTSDEGILMLPELDFLEYLVSLSFTNIIRTDIRSATLPTVLKLPQSVTRLTLTNTLLKWEELSIIQTNLPNLEVLILLHACSGPVWDASELEGFTQLKYLRIKHRHIKEWHATEDLFPQLEVLVLEYCQKLEQIPIEFGKLYDLREIKVEWCRHSVEESAKEIQDYVRNDRGEDKCPKLIAVGNRY